MFELVQRSQFVCNILIRYFPEIVFPDHNFPILRLKHSRKNQHNQDLLIYSTEHIRYGLGILCQCPDIYKRNIFSVTYIDSCVNTFLINPALLKNLS